MLDANGNVLGKAASGGGVFRDANGLLWSYHVDILSGTAATVTPEPLYFTSADCSGTLYGDTRLFKNVVFANNGVLYKTTGPYVATTMNSLKDDGSPCATDTTTRSFMVVQSIGPSPSPLPAPFEIR